MLYTSVCKILIHSDERHFIYKEHQCQNVTSPWQELLFLIVYNKFNKVIAASNIITSLFSIPSLFYIDLLALTPLRQYFIYVTYTGFHVHYIYIQYSIYLV